MRRVVGADEQGEVIAADQGLVDGVVQVKETLMLEWYWCLIIGGMIGWALRGWLDFRAINKRQREDARLARRCPRSRLLASSR